MKKQKKYQYFVEGDDERFLVSALKDCSTAMIIPGKVLKFNVVQDLLTHTQLRPLSPGTIVILIFDTDIDKIDVLEKNLCFLKRSKQVDEIWCITQVRNFEDEIVYSTDVKAACELTKSKSIKEFKAAFLKEKDIIGKLKKHNFEISKIWSRNPSGVFAPIKNEGFKIKLDVTDCQV